MRQALAGHLLKPKGPRATPFMLFPRWSPSPREVVPEYLLLIQSPIQFCMPDCRDWIGSGSVSGRNGGPARAYMQNAPGKHSVSREALFPSPWPELGVGGHMGDGVEGWAPALPLSDGSLPGQWIRHLPTVAIMPPPPPLRSDIWWG